MRLESEASTVAKRCRESTDGWNSRRRNDGQGRPQLKKKFLGRRLRYTRRLGYGSPRVARWNGLARNRSHAAGTSNPPARSSTDAAGSNGPPAESDTPPSVASASRCATAAANHSCSDCTCNTNGSADAGKTLNTSSGRPRFWAYNSVHSRLAGLREFAVRVGVGVAPHER